jgi:hypothetical protein
MFIILINTVYYEVKNAPSCQHCFCNAALYECHMAELLTVWTLHIQKSNHTVFCDILLSSIGVPLLN